MSEELDKLLKEMNDSMKGRLESDIPLDDDFWKRRARYQQAYSAADGVHIPNTGQSVELPKTEGTTLGLQGKVAEDIRDANASARTEMFPAGTVDSNPLQGGIQTTESTSTEQPKTAEEQLRSIGVK